MRKIALVCIAICISTFGAQGQEIKKMDSSPLDLAVFRPGGQDAKPVARIIYSRPQKKGREIFGKLVPYGKIWRTGANQSTELNLYQDISIGGQKLPAGNYTLYSIPNEKEWTIIINSKLFTWGAYDYDESENVMMFKVPVVTTTKEREAFGIAFAGKKGKGKLLLAWETTEIYIDFKY